MGMEFYISLFLIAIVSPRELVRAQETDEPSWPGCGPLNENDFLNFTHKAGIVEHPWTGRLAYETNRGISYLCLAILITDQHLLAPAHCFDDHENISVRYVLLGDWNPTNPFMEADCDAENVCDYMTKLMEIDEIIIHPEYKKKQMTNDISILRLTESIRYFSSSISTICLPNNNNNNNDQYLGSLQHFAGFAHNPKVPHKLKGVIQILGTGKCRRTLAYLDDLPSAIPYDINLLCGVQSNTLMPLLMGSSLMGVKVIQKKLHNYYLIGMLVGGEGNSTIPYIFIKIDPYSQWIRRQIELSTTPKPNAEKNGKRNGPFNIVNMFVIPNNDTDNESLDRNIIRLS